jgi:hypothetical protein
VRQPRWPTIVVEDEPGELLGRAYRAGLEPLDADAELRSELSQCLTEGVRTRTSIRLMWA